MERCDRKTPVNSAGKLFRSGVAAGTDYGRDLFGISEETARRFFAEHSAQHSFDSLRRVGPGVMREDEFSRTASQGLTVRNILNEFLDCRQPIRGVRLTVFLPCWPLTKIRARRGWVSLSPRSRSKERSTAIG